MVGLSLLCAWCACGARPAAPPVGWDEGRFRTEADAFYWAHLTFRPYAARQLGHHRFDGQLPDRSAQGLATEIDRLRRARAGFEAYPASSLSDVARLEREILLAEIRTELFELEVRRQPWRNPMFYSDDLELSQYVVRPYAPAPERARSIIAACRELPRFLAEARANLERQVPVTFIDTALVQVKGHTDFATKDVRVALKGLDGATAAELDACLGRYADEVGSYRDFLEARRGEGNADYALGERDFLRMLAETQGVSIDFATLERIAEEDLARNLAAAAEAARAIDPQKSVEEVVLAQARDRLPAPAMLAEASRQAQSLRQTLVDKKIVTIPSDAVAEVRETPAFMRWNAAFLDPAGPFETAKLASFYYISPPDPSWPREEQEAYLIPRHDLLFTTIHEIWPGHFLHHLHITRNPSPIVKSFCTYSTEEGWAHYVEEMMWEEGVAGDDPRYRIGQLKEALLRNVRFVSALGLHARALPVESAARLFVEKGFVDAANARQQAVRGTFDPMYLSYTLGKLMIEKLREDWKAKVGDRFSLRAFHDELLSFGCAPLPVIRERMLGSDPGPPL
jgi:hypothetical protein